MLHTGPWAIITLPGPWARHSLNTSVDDFPVLYRREQSIAQIGANLQLISAPPPRHGKGSGEEEM
jgi:hypothetical protein